MPASLPLATALKRTAFHSAAARQAFHERANRAPYTSQRKPFPDARRETNREPSDTGTEYLTIKFLKLLQSDQK